MCSFAYTTSKILTKFDFEPVHWLSIKNRFHPRAERLLLLLRFFSVLLKLGLEPARFCRTRGRITPRDYCPGASSACVSVIGPIVHLRDYIDDRNKNHIRLNYQATSNGSRSKWILYKFLFYIFLYELQSSTQTNLLWEISLQQSIRFRWQKIFQDIFLEILLQFPDPS